MKKELPLNTNNFKEIIENNYYYVDKTDFIEEYLAHGSYVSLLQRPQKYGKSLTISMLDNFFNIEYKDINKDLFKGLKIEKGEHYKELSSYPVINFSFEGITGKTYEEAFDIFKELVSKLYKEKDYLFDKLKEYDQITYQKYLDKTASDVDYSRSISTLMRYLHDYYNKDVVVLYDEYDKPLENAYINGYYDKLMPFIREIGSHSLKGNDYLKFGIITGIFRAGAPSIFSDLNNILDYNLETNIYNNAIGFTESETKELLEYYDLTYDDKIEKMYSYHSQKGNVIYNPIDILNYTKEKKLEPYWINQIDIDLIKNGIKNSDEYTIETLQKLIDGGSTTFRSEYYVMHSQYDKIDRSHYLFNILFINGFLRIAKDTREISFDLDCVFLQNDEIKLFMQKMIGSEEK